MAPKMEIRKHP
jgi:hypothetical protein